MTRFLMIALFMMTATTTHAAGPPYSPEDEALYVQRFNKLMQDARSGAGLDSYDTLEPVAGAAKLVPLKSAKQGSIAAESIEQARSYAAERKSSAFLVWRNGALEHASYFGVNTRDTPLVSKSLAKPVTALLVGRALQQGYIKSLDQPVADFITEWKSDPQKSKIKIRYLLDMRSGMLAQNVAFNPEDILNRAYLHPRHDEVIIHEYPMTHEPGTRYDYANATSEMVAPLIERATGMRYGSYLSQALLQPLGAAGGSIWVNRPGGMAHSGCCLLLPAETWLRLGLLVLQDGRWQGKRLLPKAYVQHMRTGTAENPYYGLGLWLAGTYIERRGFAHPSIEVGKTLHSAPYAAKDLVLFDGNGNQVVYIIPSEKLVIVRTGSAPPRDKEWDNAMLPNLLINAIKRTPGAAIAEPQPR
jgi:CubicO group peptidase (beta-lactamase class C family)